MSDRRAIKREQFLRDWAGHLAMRLTRRGASYSISPRYPDVPISGLERRIDFRTLNQVERWLPDRPARRGFADNFPPPLPQRVFPAFRRPPAPFPPTAGARKWMNDELVRMGAAS